MRKMIYTEKPKILTDHSSLVFTNIERAVMRNSRDFGALKDLYDFSKCVAKEELDNDTHLLRDHILFMRRYLTDIMHEQKNVNSVIEAGELLKKSYHFTSRDFFTDYMTYLEWDRPPKERFWQPRARILTPLANAIQALTDDELDELFLSMPPRIGKALANDTPILTRNGWKNHGDLVVGDEVIGMDGKFKKVIAVHPKCMLDRLVEFTNGEKIQCHERHEWLFYDRGLRKTHKQETNYWEKRGLEYGGNPGERGHRYVLQLPEKKYVEGEYKHLELDPYTFGVWLGDGANRDPRICGDKNDVAIIDKIERNGEKVTWHTTHKQTGVEYYGFGFRHKLQKYGLCHSRHRVSKYIPDDYLTASIEQRLELLAGLLDTDGSLRRKENRYSFTTVETSLRDSFMQLIATFGWRCGCVEYEPKISTSGVEGKNITYVISFNPDCYIPCALERKQLHTFSKQRAVAVKSITKVEPKEGNCITVEGDGMYLCGHTMIPTHNTTMILFLVSWIIGKHPEWSNLYSAFSDIITKAFYNGILEVINDPTTYLWSDIFPGLAIARTNAQDETLDIERKKRYPSITCRSLYGTLNGACDCRGMLISDDLIGGIEEALNKDRLASAWSKVDNNLIPRAKEGCKFLWVGTRWSIADPAGTRMNILQNDVRFKDHRYKIINVPALNEHGESNFDYDFGVGFSTKYYMMRKASFIKNNDEASWLAQYMGEPVERAGTLFERADMRYFNGELPDDRSHIRTFAACDPAFGGGDFCAMAICCQYEEGTFVVDVLYSNADKSFTQPTIANKLMEWNVGSVQFECNASTVSFKEGVEKILKEKNFKCNVTYKAAPNQQAKEVRIYEKAPEIRELYFLEGSYRSREYEQFMTNVFSFQISGKNKHDDAPDCLAMCVEVQNYNGISFKVRKRVF